MTICATAGLHEEEPVAETGSQFQALGRNWILLAEDDDAVDMGELLTGSAVGSMTIGGRSYFIFAGDPDAEPGDDNGMFGRVAEDVLAILTPRELQVCELIAAGRCDKQIARSLGISATPCANTSGAFSPSCRSPTEPPFFRECLACCRSSVLALRKTQAEPIARLPARRLCRPSAERG